MTLLRDMAVVAALLVALGGSDVLLNGAGPDLAYRFGMTLRFAGIVLGIVAVVALIVRLLLLALDGVLGRALRRDVRVLVGWNFLKVSRTRFPPALRLRALRDAWFGEGNARRGLGVLLLLMALSLASLTLSPPVWGLLPPLSPILARWLRLSPLFLALPLALRGLAHLLLRPASASARREELSRRRGLSGGRDFKSVPASVFVSVVGISMGVWALIVVISVLSGFQNDLKGKLVAYHPNLEVATRLAGDSIPGWEGLAGKLAQLPGVTRVAALVSGEAMVSSPSNINVNITVNGIDPATYGQSGPFTHGLKRGDFRHLDRPEVMLSDSLLRSLLSPKAPGEAQPQGGMGSIFAATPDAYAPLPGLVLGSELAASLHVEPGSEVQLISPEGEVAPTGLIPRTRSFQVVGVFDTGLYEYDLKTVFISRAEAARFFHAGVNRLHLRLADLDDTDRVMAQVGAATNAPDHGPIWGSGGPTNSPPDSNAPYGGLQLKNWKQFNRNLFSALALEKLVMVIVLGFIVLVASFNIMSSLSTVILGKTRDIAILRGMGMGRDAILSTFKLIGLVVGVFGAAAGALLGWVSCLFIDRVGIHPPVQLYLQKLPVDLEPWVIAAILAVTVGLSYVATLLPARRAAAVLPTEGLRYE
jgi:lipoprotein-releasing system permease protein